MKASPYANEGWPLRTSPLTVCPTSRIISAFPLAKSTITRSQILSPQNSNFPSIFHWFTILLASLIQLLFNYVDALVNDNEWMRNVMAYKQKIKEKKHNNSINLGPNNNRFRMRCESKQSIRSPHEYLLLNWNELKLPNWYAHWFSAMCCWKSCWWLVASWGDDSASSSCIFEMLRFPSHFTCTHTRTHTHTHTRNTQTLVHQNGRKKKMRYHKYRQYGRRELLPSVNLRWNEVARYWKSPAAGWHDNTTEWGPPAC